MQGERHPDAEGEARAETEGDVIMECLIQRPPETYFHTLLESESKYYHFLPPLLYFLNILIFNVHD